MWVSDNIWLARLMLGIERFKIGETSIKTFIRKL
jgi:hypothetical protein